MEKITVVITAFNEEKKIQKAIESSLWADQVILVNGQSQDNTRKIAQKFPIKIIDTPNDPHMMSMRNKGIMSAKTPWVMILDADEIITDDLAQEIRRTIQKTEHNGFLIPRKQFFAKKWVKNCGWYPDYQLRLFRKEKAFYPNKSVHEQAKIVEGSVGKLKKDFLHYPYLNLQEYLKKVNRYINHAAEEKLKKGQRMKISDLLIRPPSRFFKIYFWEKGFLSGWRGLFLSFFSAYHELGTFFCFYQKIKKKKRQKLQTKLISQIWTKQKYYQTSFVFDSEFCQSIWFEKINDQISPSNKILDVGCGDGTNLENLVNKNRNVSGWGIDISPLAIRSAKEKENKNLHFSQQNGENLNFKDNEFDLVFSIACLEHLTNPEKVIEEIIRVTKTKGRIILWTLNFGSPFVFPHVNKSSPSVQIIQGIFKSFFRTIFPSRKSLSWKEHYPSILDPDKFKPDDDLTTEPEIQTFIQFVKKRKIRVIEANTGLNYSSQSPRKIIRKISPLIKKINQINFLPFRYWGQNFFIILEKN